MYELKTLLPQFDINLPTRMYALRNINLPPNIVMNGNVSKADNSKNELDCKGPSKVTSKNAFTASSSSATAPSKGECVLNLDSLSAQIQRLLKVPEESQKLQQRQEKIIKQLHEIQEMLTKLRANVGVCQKGVKHTHPSANGGLIEEPLQDIVINGHPNFIPFALLALKNAWQSSFNINVKTFTHSTMADIGPEAREFEQKLSATPLNPNLATVNVTLIWKNCEHTEMISSPTMYVPIYGEVNIIRYLGRVGPQEFRYEDSPLCNEIDAVLDICYQLLRCTTPKSRTNMVRALNNRLKKQDYFGGNHLSVADIGVYSSLKRIPAITDKDLTPTLLAWRKRTQLVTRI